jgi:eukaryotic-like serine/threonine-protein kinase
MGDQRPTVPSSGAKCFGGSTGGIIVLMVDDADRPTTPSDTVPGARRRRGNLTLNDYVVGEVIGTGGMGEVILAHDRRIGRDVAVKRLREADPSEETLERFMREAKIQARLDHPTIVPVHEIGRDSDGNPYFTMKRLAGVTLAERLQGSGPIQPLLRALVDVCFAIDLAHNRGVVHRDLKPANIMLGDYGEVYVLDWGIARVLDELDDLPARSSRPVLDPGTQTGAMLGTPGYMAPEQIRGERTVGPPADIYSLGAILFEILAGEPLHPRGDAVAATLVKPTDSPAARRPDRQTAPELDRLCVEALAENPAQRPTARAFAQRVQAYLDGDRDIEHRRTLAAHQLDVATAALAAGKRGEGIFAAGRALALDPESIEASELVVSLLVEPPRPLPPELELALAQGEQAIERQRSGRAVVPLLTLFVLLPLAALVPVASWGALGALLVGAFVLAVIAFTHWRFGWHVPSPALFVLSLGVSVVFSRIAGPLLLTPILVCGLLIVIGARATPARAGYHVVVFAILAIGLPLALEQAGVLTPTVALPDGPGLLFSSAVFDNAAARVPRLFALSGGTLLITIIVALYAHVLVRQRQIAQRALQIQTWTLQQLLPHTRAPQADGSQ